MPFVIHGLVPQNVLNAWNVIGDLVMLLWHTKIDDMEDYLVSIYISGMTLSDCGLERGQATLSRTIQDFLNITAQCAPSILISKPKFHFLVHLPAYIRRFGPAILFSTERYESFNHVFRLSSIYSNHQAPSRDTCISFARQDTVRHIALGGYWYDPTKRRWRRAGQAVMEYMDDHPKEKVYLGYTQPVSNHGTSLFKSS